MLVVRRHQSGSVLGQGDKEAKWTKGGRKGLRTVPGAEGMGAEETRWAMTEYPCPDGQRRHTGGWAGHADWTSSPREKPRFCAVIPEIHSPDPCGGQASCHFVLL